MTALGIVALVLAGFTIVSNLVTMTNPKKQATVSPGVRLLSLMLVSPGFLYIILSLT